MRATEFIVESWGIQKYPIPLPIGDYLGPESDEFAPPGNYSDAGDLHEEVWDLMDDGIEPRVVNVDPKRLYATQDWLSNEGGGEPLFPEFQDKPVIYKKDGRAYILDGHHRTTKAWKAGRPISVYLFSDELDEATNPDIHNNQFKHQQQIGDFVYKAEADNNSGYGTTLVITAYDGKKEIASVEFIIDEDADSLTSANTWVLPKYQELGIATTMYAYAKMLGNDITPSRIQTDQGHNMWRSWNQKKQSKHILPKGHKGYHEYAEDAVQENFHDGKNPQDKGDSKRLGVPTKASVSTLRKVAKQGGRKGQLAHWMANMKAGKAKKK